MKLCNSICSKVRLNHGFNKGFLNIFKIKIKVSSFLYSLHNKKICISCKMRRVAFNGRTTKGIPTKAINYKRYQNKRYCYKGYPLQRVSATNGIDYIPPSLLSRSAQPPSLSCHGARPPCQSSRIAFIT